jgi:hypothetical protein
MPFITEFWRWSSSVARLYRDADSVSVYRRDDADNLLAQGPRSAGYGVAHTRIAVMTVEREVTIDCKRNPGIAVEYEYAAIIAAGLRDGDHRRSYE